MDETQTYDYDRIRKINIEDEMKSSYIDYSMSVIVAASSRYTAAYSMVCSALTIPATSRTRSVRV